MSDVYFLFEHVLYEWCESSDVRAVDGILEYWGHHEPFRQKVLNIVLIQWAVIIVHFIFLYDDLNAVSKSPEFCFYLLNPVDLKAAKYEFLES